MGRFKTRPHSRLSACRVPPAQAAALEDGYAKERRAQYNFLIKQEALGPLAPSAAFTQRATGRTASPAALAEDSELIQSIRHKEGEELARLHASQSLWASVNPGMVFSLPGSCMSDSRQEYVDWGSKEAGLLDTQRLLNGRHNRCKNDISEYVEASAKYAQIMKRAGSPERKAAAKS